MHRGLSAYCSACGAPRPLLSGRSLTHAGVPQQIGGGAARALGWILLAVATPIAALVAIGVSLFAGIEPALLAFVLLFGPALAAWLLLRRKAGTLEERGQSEIRSRQRDALGALAAVSGGVLRADRAALHLGVSTQAADQLLTDLAKDDPAAIEVDVTERGEVLYRFTAYAPSPVVPDGLRIEPTAPRTRIAADGPPDEPASHEELAELDSATHERGDALRTRR